MTRRPIRIVLLLGIVGIATAAGGEEPVNAEASAPAEADLGQVRGFVDEGKFEEAERIVSTLQEARPDDPALLLLRGELLLQLGRPDQAREVLQDCLAIDDERARANFALAGALAQTGETEAALAAFAREIELNEDPEVRLLARLNRSLIAQQERRWEEAAAELEAALEIRPERTEVFGDLATLYLEAGRFDDAERALQRGSESGFRSAEHYYSLGARLYRDERFGRAVECLTRALEIDPGLARAERSLAAALERLGRPEEALEHLRRYLELAPNAPDAEEVSEILAGTGEN